MYIRYCLFFYVSENSVVVYVYRYNRKYSPLRNSVI